MKHIVCFHLFNDYSGSPKVLKMVIDGFLNNGYKIDLVTSKGGVLDEIESKNLTRHTYSYHFSSNPLMTMIKYIAVQLYTFLYSFRFIFDKDTTFYINTILPVGPALAGRIMGKKIVYHYHENAGVKSSFYRMLAFFMQKIAHEIICVSAYQASFLKRRKNVTVIPNALPHTFISKLAVNLDTAFERKTVLLLGSLKLYKGTLQFIELAENLSFVSFVLVLNDTQDNIDFFLKEHKITIPRNLEIFSRQKDVTPFYNRSSLVLNLSNKEYVIETFGLTALEAMSAALPVIVPTVGGIAELVEDGKNGYKIDVQELDKIEEVINTVLTDEKLYLTLANNAYEFSKQFSEKLMIHRISDLL